MIRWHKKDDFIIIFSVCFVLSPDIWVKAAKTPWLIHGMEPYEKVSHKPHTPCESVSRAGRAQICCPRGSVLPEVKAFFPNGPVELVASI